MEELESASVEPKKKASKILLLLTFMFSFLFFLYLTFPYNVVKELIASEVSKQAGMNLVVGTLEPSLPIGLSVTDVEVSTKSGSGAFRLKEVDVSLNVFSLFLGKVGATVSVLAPQKGTLDVLVSMGLGQVFNQDFTPSTVELDAKNFPINGLADFGVATAAKNMGRNQQLIGDFIKMLRLGGELDGVIDMDIEPSDLSQSSGQLNLDLKKGFFLLDDANLNIAKQNFRKAKISANLDNSKLSISKNSGFVSQELKLLFSGFVQFKQSLNASLIEVPVEVEVRDGLQKAIGGILEFAIGATDGKAKFIMRGPLMSPKQVKG